jgi:hypothetical protein
MRLIIILMLLFILSGCQEKKESPRKPKEHPHNIKPPPKRG